MKGAPAAGWRDELMDSVQTQRVQGGTLHRARMGDRAEAGAGAEGGARGARGRGSGMYLAAPHLGCGWLDRQVRRVLDNERGVDVARNKLLVAQKELVEGDGGWHAHKHGLVQGTQHARNRLQAGARGMNQGQGA